MSSYALWKDFDWKSYLESELKRCPSEKERDELRSAVTLVRTYLRVFAESKPSMEDLERIPELEKATGVETFSHALAIAAQLANVQSNLKRTESNKLTFAITAISHAATHCRAGQFEKILPVFIRFAKEVGE